MFILGELTKQRIKKREQEEKTDGVS